ncbi:MAG: hypothetical protein M1337_02680 [Actinobacteria bacterium]|nr:hypothetical protein [Actinomycetota bacterium]
MTGSFSRQPVPSPEPTSPAPEPTPTEPDPTPTPTPEPTPSDPAPSPDPALVCGTVDTPCHVVVSDSTVEFLGVAAVLILFVLAAILGAQLRRA